MSRLDGRTASMIRDQLTAHDEEYTPDVIMVSGFGNTSLVLTEEGVVVVDTARRTSLRALEEIRARTQAPIHTIIYTHGHGDHAWTAAPFLEDASKSGHPRPRIIAHELLPRRFDRYRKLDGYHQYINRIQFGRGDVPVADDERFLPAEVAYPDITYSDEMQFRLGGLTFELYHNMGETDDGTWVWVPERRTAIIGDLGVWFCPNIGNPFKVQRYALERVAGKNPDFLIPGHGPAFRGSMTKEFCLTTADFLRHLENEVIRLLNEGCWIEEILERVKVPESLASKPWLHPVYGCLTFIIHGIHRRYAGWYNGNPSQLFPSRTSDIASEVARLCQAERLIQRARELQHEGNTQLALHLADLAVKGADDTLKRKEALLLYVELLDARADAETNFIAKNIFLYGAEAAEQEAGLL